MPFARFVISGGINTGLTYCIYLFFQMMLSYQVAYLIAYVAGIFIAYFMSSLFVFNKPVSLRSFFRFPIVYIVQYGVGAVLLWLLVSLLNVSSTYAPLIVIAVTLPLTFLLSRFILNR